MLWCVISTLIDEEIESHGQAVINTIQKDLFYNFVVANVFGLSVFCGAICVRVCVYVTW